jgi:hypothetical protein
MKPNATIGVSKNESIRFSSFFRSLVISFIVLRPTSINTLGGRLMMISKKERLSQVAGWPVARLPVP